jgi:phosphoribosyl 1,2-cyclic phosphodiesterase
MILTCLASGSSGNCYVLKDNKGKMLLLDAGIPIMKIKKGCDWKVSDIVGCVATHKHGDHSEAVSDLEEMGIPVYKPYEDNSYIGGYGEFRIVSVPMNDVHGHFKHTDADGTECPCYGFIIEHPEMGRMLYITDTEFVRWRFKDIDHILVSCNYQKKYISEDVTGKRLHVIKGHMELETCAGFVEANTTNALQNVIICHLSANNAVPEEMVTRIKKTAGMANVDVAEAGKTWQLFNCETCPFL